MCTCPRPRWIAGWSRRGKKIDLRQAYEPWIVEHFSGYLCIDEIYDGPYCIFYAVDPVLRKRVAFQISDAGTEAECRRFLQYLADMGLRVQGATTDGSHLYPNLIREIFPGATHQVCVFHVIKELNLLVLRALAGFRKSLPKPPPGKRGRPRKGEKSPRENPAVRLKREVWENRHLWVKHHLTPAERRRLARMVRGRPLLRGLRELVDLVYALFDRRCRTATAIQKLERLRRHRLFKAFPQLEAIRRKLMSPNLEKALLFLDDSMLEPTSNAVERENRRHRKRQKTIYRARTRRSIAGRIRFSMLHDLEPLIARFPENRHRLPNSKAG